MNGWKVDHSKDFVDKLKNTRKQFEDRYETIREEKLYWAIPSARQQLKGFSHFTHAVLNFMKEVNAGRLEPTEALKFYDWDTGGTIPICSLARGRWRGLYSIDRPLCYGISVGEMNFSARVRRWLSRPLR